MFCIDVENSVRRTTGHCITLDASQLSLDGRLDASNVIIYFSTDRLDVKVFLFVQYLIIMGKYHLHKKRWSDYKSNFTHFLREFKDYGASLKNTKNKKAKRTLEFYVEIGRASCRERVSSPV